jgi:hypothetical protein
MHKQIIAADAAALKSADFAKPSENKHVLGG